MAAEWTSGAETFNAEIIITRPPFNGIHDYEKHILTNFPLQITEHVLQTQFVRNTRVADMLMFCGAGFMPGMSMDVEINGEPLISIVRTFEELGVKANSNNIIKIQYYTSEGE